MTVPQGEGEEDDTTGVGDLLLGDGEKERRKKRPHFSTLVFFRLWRCPRPDLSQIGAVAEIETPSQRLRLWKWTRCKGEAALV
jgi:hypothetical protein